MFLSYAFTRDKFFFKWPYLSLHKAYIFIKKETLAQVFSSEIFEIFNNTFFTEHLRTTVSEFLR